MATVSIDGVSIHYEARGEGPTLVLLHPFPCDGRIFRRQLEALSDEFRVIVPDLRGFGRSTYGDPFTMELLARDTCALLASIDALPCVLVGSSMGGYVALEVVRAHPADVRGLVLLGSRAQADTSEQKIGRVLAFRSVLDNGAGPFVEGMLRKMPSERTKQSSEDVVDELRTIMNDCPARTIEHGLLALMARADHMRTLGALEIPVLLAIGADDVLTPPSLATEMQQANPRAEVVVLDNAGHLPSIETPGEVNDLLRTFARRATVPT